VSRNGRVYRRLLRLYPVQFRREYADEMTRLFDEQVRDARRAGGTGAVMNLWIRAVADLVATALLTRLREQERVLHPAGPIGSRTGPQPALSSRGRVLVALTPFWALLLFLAQWPGFLDPLFEVPPGIAGMPAGSILLAAVVLWTLFGAWVMRARTSSIGVLLTLLVFPLPATIVILFGPALILIVQNLG